MKTPILITGSHRSGTTWVGSTVGKSKDVRYLWEPFNFHFGPGICNAPFEYHFPYVTEANEDKYIKSVRQTLTYHYHLLEELKTVKSKWQLKKCFIDFYRFQAAKIKKQRPLFKDPIAIFSAPWLARRFDFQVVMLIRHPAAFANSLKRLNWNYDFNELFKQPLLINGPLAPFKNRIEDYARTPRDITDQASLLWNLFHFCIRQYRDDHPDWLFLRHEDLSLEPVSNFKTLFKYLNLEFTPDIETHILKHTGSENPTGSTDGQTAALKMNSRENITNWKKYLSPDEIARIEKDTREVAQDFYSPSEW